MSKYIFLQFELVYFDNIWLTHSEQYRWYQVLYQLGVFVSRTSVNLFPIEKIWILSILQVCRMNRLFSSKYNKVMIVLPFKIY